MWVPGIELGSKLPQSFVLTTILYPLAWYLHNWQPLGAVAGNLNMLGPSHGFPSLPDWQCRHSSSKRFTTNLATRKHSQVASFLVPVYRHVLHHVQQCNLLTSAERTLRLPIAGAAESGVHIQRIMAGESELAKLHGDDHDSCDQRRFYRQPSPYGMHHGRHAR